MGKPRPSLHTVIALLLALGLSVAAVPGAKTAPATAPQATIAPMFDNMGAHDGGVTLHFAALGRGDVLTSLAPVSPIDDGTRAAYIHGDTTEWYLRQGMGIEQGVTLTAAPPGDGPLVLDIAMPGVVPVVDADGAGATLLPTVAGRATGWRYTDLHVIDAAGRIVPARLDEAAGGVRIVVDDAGAAYPLVIDPFLTLQTFTEPTPGNNDYFANVAMSADGNTIVVGAIGTSSKQGRVYIYTKSGGSYGSPLTLSEPAPGADANFGTGVAVSADGSTVVVGANGTSSSPGSAYVYTKSGGSYGPPVTLSEPFAANNDQFGFAVAMSADGSTVLIGAIGTSNNQGRAYVYTKSGGSYGSTATLSEPIPGNNDLFGFAVAMSADGNTVVVGAIGTSVNQGGAYVYTKSGSSYGSPATLSDPTATTGDKFGYGVTMSADGGTVVVGAPGVSSNQGRAYVYTKGGSSYSLSTTLGEPAAASNDNLGFAVAISADGNTAIVGAPGAGSNQGRAYVYTKSGGSYGPPTTLSAPLAANNDQFGDPVAISADGSVVAIGAPGTNSAQGSAYILVNHPTLAADSTTTPQSATIGTAFSTRFAAIATDSYGIALANKSVTFTVPATGASGHFAAGSGVSADGLTATVTTDTTGVATAPLFTANTAAGSYSMTATMSLIAGSATTTFSLTNTAGAAASIAIVSGDHQSVQLDSNFTAPLRVRVLDAEGNPVGGATVTFTAPSGSGPSAIFANSGVATTDPSGYASITATASGRPGLFMATAAVTGVSPPASFTLTDIAASSTLILTGFSPPIGPIAGGTLVTLHGANFSKITGATVTFGGANATNVAVVDGTTITAVAPAHAAGTVDITVTTGMQTATIHGYTYLGTGNVAPQPGNHPLPGSIVPGPMVQPQRHDATDSGGGVGTNAVGMPTPTPAPAPQRH